ncbi:MAG: hypothetical protein IPF42_14100 [Candidatus Microthrix sp.]|nr:hypothetical protein [Candidatus Microthrix sp.]
MVSLKLAELGAVDRGIRSEYYPDGQLKAQGRMKDGKPSGRWKWFDKDGSLKQVGTFRVGERTGTWTSYDSDGNLTDTTTY